MKINSLFCAFAVVAISSLAQAPDPVPVATADLRENGVFEFPQKRARILCDTEDLRFSVWNNSKYLFAQAVVWRDDDSSLGKTDDNREIGDWSEVLLDLNADSKPTPKVDRDYSLNPWPGLEGLHYQVSLGQGATTGLMSDSRGRGAIRYVENADRSECGWIRS